MSAARKLSTWEEPDTLRFGVQSAPAANDNAVQALDDAGENSPLGIFVFPHTSLPACEPANDGIAPAKLEAPRRTTSEAGITGKEEDVEVGLQYFGKRYLNPLLGRWVSADPLAVHAPGEADANLYAYVGGMVLKATDPLGLETVVSAQHSDEYPKSAGALGTARKLAQSMGVSKVGVHWKSKGFERQVAGGNVDRIDSVGHYASGFALEDNGYALDEGIAGRLAPHLTNDVKIVIHGCGVPSGTFANTERFLSKLGSDATLYTHRNKSGPGMPMNFVRHKLVNDGEGGKKLDSHLMSGSDKVIGEILSEDYVKWWTGKQSTDDLKRFMGDKEHFTLTDDVRKVFQDELDSRQPASPNSENSYNGEGQSSGDSAESQSAAAGEGSDENAEAD